MVPSRKQVAHELPGTKSSLLGPERVSRPLPEQDASCSNRHDHSGGLYKQGRRHEGRLTQCPSLEDCDLVFHETGYSQSLTYSTLTECGSRQAFQARAHHPKRVVSSSRGLPVNWHQPQIDLFGTRFNKLSQFVSPVSDPLAWAVDVFNLPWEDLDLYAFPPVAIMGKVVA